MAMPTLSVEARLSERARALGRKRTKAIASSTSRAVSAFTWRVRLTTCETVETETPARRATSTIVDIGDNSGSERRRPYAVRHEAFPLPSNLDVSKLGLIVK